MAEITEIAPDMFRISVYAPQLGLSFNHFLIRDDEPLLFHAGFRAMFEELREAVARLLDPAAIRHIGFSHFESDECGALNRWLELAPEAKPLCGLVGALVNINDFAIRPARVLKGDEPLITGKRRFRLLQTPHLPHGWDAGVLFEETDKTLFCSDLLLQTGECAPLVNDSIVERARQALLEAEAGPFAHATPYTADTGRTLERLAAEGPRTLATMHGSSYSGDGARELRELAGVLREVLAPN
jgi:flavorubredoxin